MELQIFEIGQKKGIYLPDNILKKYNILGNVEVVFEEEHFLIKAKIKPRNGWEKKFEEMHKNQDDELLIDDVFNEEEI